MAQTVGNLTGTFNVGKKSCLNIPASASEIRSLAQTAAEELHMLENGMQGCFFFTFFFFEYQKMSKTNLLVDCVYI